MIDVEDLIALVRNYNPRSNAGLIRDAYEYGMRMHEGQFRHSGEPYFTHPIAVAAILTEMRLDDATIVTALLHDVVEDTSATRDDIAGMFGEEVAVLVEGVTKLSRLELQAELRRLQRELDDARQQLAAQRRPKHTIASFIGASAAAMVDLTTRRVPASSGAIRVQAPAGDAVLTPALMNTLRVAGYAFSIWSLIYAGILAYAVRQVLPQTGESEMINRMGWPSAVAFFGIGLWIIVAALNLKAASVAIIAASAIWWGRGRSRIPARTVAVAAARNAFTGPPSRRVR